MSRKKSIARSAGMVSIAVGISRVLGLAREMMIAGQFSRVATDAFFSAFRIPNLLRDLLAEGALSSAFVPAFAEVKRNKGPEEAFRLANSVINGLLLITGLFALSILLFADLFALTIASGFEADKLELVAFLARLMSPFLMTVSAAAVLMGIGNVYGRFFVPALAPALFNVGVLTGGFLMAPWLESRGYPGVTGLAAGAVVGGFLQLVAQLPGVVRDGYRPQYVLALRDPAVRRIIMTMGPASLAVAATYINVMVDNQISSYYGEGPVSYLFFAFRLWMLPIGLFAVAISIANLTSVSEHAARKDMVGLRSTLAASVRLTLLLTVPAAAALMALGPTIVRVVYERGPFTPEATEATAWVLALYAIGLPGYGLVKVFVPTFYALDDPWTPAKISASVVLMKVAMNFALVWPMAYPGLALSTGLAALINALWTRQLLVRRTGSLSGHQIGRALLVSLTASAAMVASTWLAGRGALLVLDGADFVSSAARLAIQVLVGLMTVALIVRFSGLPESDLLSRVLQRRRSG